VSLIHTLNVVSFVLFSFYNNAFKTDTMIATTAMLLIAQPGGWSRLSSDEQQALANYKTLKTELL